MSEFDPSKVVDVTSTRKSASPYDLMYKENSGKFRLSEDGFIRLDIQNNGLRIAKYPTGDIVLTLVPENEARVYARRQGVEQKGKSFSSEALRSMLTNRFGEDVNLFEMNHAATGDDGREYFIVSPYENGGLKDFVLAELEDVETLSDTPDEARPSTNGRLNVETTDDGEIAVETTTTVDTSVDDDEETSAMLDGVDSDTENAVENEDVNEIASVDEAASNGEPEYTDETTDDEQPAASDEEDVDEAEEDEAEQAEVKHPLSDMSFD